MKNLSTSVFSMLAATLAVSASASAAECQLHVSRTACPGKETESYSKCNGKQSCDTVVDTLDAASCAEAALKSCENKRFDITQYKSVVARFQGVDFAAGRDFCDKDSGSYVVTVNYPFRELADCKN